MELATVTRRAPTETDLRRNADVGRLNRLDAALRAFAGEVQAEGLQELAEARTTGEDVEILLGQSLENTPPGLGLLHC